MLKMTGTTIGKVLKKDLCVKEVPQKRDIEQTFSDKQKPAGIQIYDIFYYKYPKTCCFWIPTREAVKVEGDKVTVYFANKFGLELFSEKHDSSFKECCREFFGRDNFNVSYEVDSSFLPNEKLVPHRVDDYPTNKKQEPVITFPYKTKGLDDLVLFQGNRDIIEEGKFMLSLLARNQEPQSVVYVKGPNGSGKTQNISSIGKDASEKGILMKYIRPRHIIDYFRLHNGRSPTLPEYLKNVKILAIDSFDDIFNPKGEALKGVQSLIQEFFDYALERKMQVVLASTQKSRDLVLKLEEVENSALRDRVAGVKRIGIELPFEDRVEFLKNFIPDLVNNYPKNKDELEKLAQSYHNSLLRPVSIRDMAGTFLTASKIAQRQGRDITPHIVNCVSYYQPSLFAGEKDVKPLEVLSVTVNLVSDLDVKEVLGKSRKRQIVDARNYAAFALYKICRLNYSEIGKVIGKTHSTAIKGVADAIEKLGSEGNIESFLMRVKKNLIK